MRVLVCSLWIALGVLCTSTYGDHFDGDDNSQGNAPGPSSDIQKVYHKNVEFAFSLYKHIAAQPDSQSKNVLFSPLSVSLALAALSVGARGHTHQQLFNGLGFNETDISPEEVNEAFHQIIMNVEKKKGVDLSVGGALFIRDTVKLLPELLESLKLYFHSEGFTIDFTNTTKTKDLINNYIKEKTKGKITDLLKKMDADMAMYLISYIYFKGSWEMPFNPENTKADVFHVNENTTVSVQMMNQRRFFDVYYDREIAAHVLQLPYKESISMLLVLPERGLKTLEDIIQGYHVRKWHKWVKTRECHVFVPKISLSASYSLEHTLNKMGMADVFSASANFTGISEEEALYVSKIVHQSTLDIDELGTTGTAVTHISLRPLSFSTPLTLKFNRPFLFIIYDHDTINILFMGKILNPMT